MRNRKIAIGIGVVVLLLGIVVYATLSTPPSYNMQSEIVGNGWACDQPVSGHLQFKVTVNSVEFDGVYYPCDVEQIDDGYLLLVDLAG